MTTDCYGPPPGHPALPVRRTLPDASLCFRDTDPGGSGHAGTSAFQVETGRPTVLLHGLTSTADLTWFSVFDALAARGRVIAPDLPGHGASPALLPFSLDRSADAVARLIETELAEPALVVGFSMGGVIAQLLWRRHPHLIAGLMFCSSAADFRPETTGAWVSQIGKRAVLAQVSRAPGAAQHALARALQAVTVSRTARAAETSPLQAWARRQVQRGDPLGVAATSAALRRFDSRPWVASVDVPCAAVLTTRDSVISITRQRQLVTMVDADPVVEAEGDHGMFVESSTAWSAAMLDCHRALCIRIAANSAARTEQ